MNIKGSGVKTPKRGFKSHYKTGSSGFGQLDDVLCVEFNHSFEDMIIPEIESIPIITTAFTPWAWPVRTFKEQFVLLEFRFGQYDTCKVIQFPIEEVLLCIDTYNRTIPRSVRRTWFVIFIGIILRNAAITDLIMSVNDGEDPTDEREEFTIPILVDPYVLQLVEIWYITALLNYTVAQFSFLSWTNDFDSVIPQYNTKIESVFRNIFKVPHHT